MEIRKSKIISGVVVAALVIIAGYSLFMRSESASDLPKFRLSLITWVGNGPFWLAEEKGYFKDEGVKAELSIIDDTALRKSTLTKGDVDAVGDTTVDMLTLSRDEGVPAKAVMQIDYSNGADGIVATDKFKSIQDLRGQKIAVQKNFVSEALLDYLLKKNGLSTKDVSVIDMEAGAAGAAFVSGQVDAAVTFEPWLSKAKERRGGHILASSADEPGVIVDVLSVNEKYLQKNSVIVKKIMRAWFKAVDYWQNHPDEANAIMAKHYNVTPAEFRDLISGLKWPTYQGNLNYFGTIQKPGPIYDVARVFSQLFLETGQIKNAPDMNQAVDSSLLFNLYQN